MKLFPPFAKRPPKSRDTDPPLLPPSRASEDALDMLENQRRTPDDVRRVDTLFWAGAVLGTLLFLAAAILLVRGCSANPT